MNIVKINSRNQVSIPREVMAKISLDADRIVKVVAVDNNEIRIIPVSAEPVISQKAVDRLVDDTIKTSRRSKSYSSVRSMLKNLRH